MMKLTSAFKSPLKWHIQRLSLLLFLLLFAAIALNLFREQTFRQRSTESSAQIQALKTETENLKAELTTLKNEDPRKTNAELRQKIATVETTFRLASTTLENLSDARGQGINVATLETDLAKAINLLGQLKYEEANNQLSTINQKVTQLVSEKQTQVAQAATPAQDLPGAGSYRRQSVTTSRGTYTVSLIAETASGVKMITDTANDDTCAKDCQAIPLATYVQRNGGFAGINGSYFCPPDYPSCADKVNSFNTLAFNSRLKKYMNSDQNVYSTVPMVVQNADKSLRFMGQSLEWGRDTGIIGGLANQPMLVSGGEAVNSDEGGKGPRGFLGVKSGVLYIGVVHGANLGDAAATLATLGLETAMNLDGGGSSALFYNGKYVVGPGRNLPNAIILAR